MYFYSKLCHYRLQSYKIIPKRAVRGQQQRICCVRQSDLDCHVCLYVYYCRRKWGTAETPDTASRSLLLYWKDQRSSTVIFVGVSNPSLHAPMNQDGPKSYSGCKQKARYRLTQIESLECYSIPCFQKSERSLQYSTMELLFPFRRLPKYRKIQFLRVISHYSSNFVIVRAMLSITLDPANVDRVRESGRR
jgi:hypothetical protein